jgi:hypothetical protein
MKKYHWQMHMPVAITTVMGRLTCPPNNLFTEDSEQTLINAFKYRLIEVSA